MEIKHGFVKMPSRIKGDVVFFKFGGVFAQHLCQADVGFFRAFEDAPPCRCYKKAVCACQRFFFNPIVQGLADFGVNGDGSDAAVCFAFGYGKESGVFSGVQVVCSQVLDFAVS